MPAGAGSYSDVGFTALCRLSSFMTFAMILSKPHTVPVEPVLAFPPEKPSPFVWLILALALAVRLWGTWFGQPHVLHPDEHWIAQVALNMLKGPPYDLNPHFFEYPSLYIYLIAFAYLILGLALQACGVIENLSQLYDYAAANLFYFHLYGRILSAFFGAATVYLTYLAGRRLYGANTGLYAAWFLTFAYVHFTDSHFLATDVPSAFFVMLAFYISIAALRSSRQKLFYWAGLVAGLAASTKYPAALILLTVLAAAFHHRRAAGASWRGAAFCSPIFITVLCAAAGFLLGTPYAVFDFKSFASGLLLQLLHSEAGHLGVPESGFWGYFTSVVPSGGVGAMLVLAIFAGMLLSLQRARAHDLLLLSFPLFFYLLIGTSALKVDRYLIPVIPFWCVYAGIAVMRASLWLARPPWLRRLAAPMLALLFSVSSIYYAGKWCWIAVQEDTRLQAAEWMETHFPEETVIALHSGAWMLPPLSRDRFTIVAVNLFMEESMKDRLALKLALWEDPASAWVLRRFFGYDINPATVDSLRAALQNMPDFTMWRAPELDYYHARNAHFVIISSLLQRRFFDPATMAKYPGMTKSMQEFYRELEERGKLVKEFSPPPAQQHKWGMGFLERPVIRIYDIRNI